MMHDIFWRYAALCMMLFAAASVAAETSVAGRNGLDGESPLVLFTAMTGRPGAKEAAEYFDAAQKAGFSQMMLYPRSGLELDYMGDEWLDFVGACLKEAKSRGMKAWLYDEYNWPSGSCKGRVPAENPEWMYAEYVVWKNPDGTFRWDVQRKETFSMYDKYFDVNAYSADAIRRFIELTHKVYESRFAIYMKDGTVPGVFTDEPAHPSVMKWDGEQPVVHFRWYRELESQYRDRTGRDFRADVEESLRDPSKTEVWEVYTELKGLQFRRAYFDQIGEWAKGVGVKTCGHMIAENNPKSACNFNGMPLNTLCGLSIPGMDKIGFDMEKNSEWLTYATAQYAIEHNSTPGLDMLDSHGGIELFALGPCDITMAQMAQRLWAAALYGMDTYFVSLYHTTAKGFLEKGGYAMFASPTQPWFDHCGELHDTARRAAKWSRRRFVRDVAIRYPQRLFGRLALGRNALDEKDPPLCGLVNEFAWGQVSFELVQDDERTGHPYVFAFRGSEIVEECSGMTFPSASAAYGWLRGVQKDAWRVTNVNGEIVPGLLVRRYSDGTAAVLNMTERTHGDLTLVRGESGSIPFALPACGVRLFADGETAWVPRRTIGEVECDGWELSLDRPNLRRVWFDAKGAARLYVDSPLRSIRFALCNFPEAGVAVELDGRPLVAVNACTAAPYGYASIYRETEQIELAAGVHELKLKGRADDSVFLPVLWLIGDFRAAEPNIVRPTSRGIPRLMPLVSIGLQDFAGKVRYRTVTDVPSEAILELDTGGLVASVRLGGVDLGEKALLPFEWIVPKELSGRRLSLEVELITSVRPVFGDEKSPDAAPRGLWASTQRNAATSGLKSAKWLKQEGSVPNAANLRLI